MLVLDTSVWRNAPTTRRTQVRRLAAAGADLVIASEAIHELAVVALTTRDPDELESVRLACVLAARYCDASLPPIEWHLARQVGLRVPPAPDPMAVCRFVGEHRSQTGLLAAQHQDLLVGGAMHVTLASWPRLVEEEKARWLASIRNALEGGAPGLVDARREGSPRRISSEEYHSLKRALSSDAPALSKIEIVGMKRRFEDLSIDVDDPVLIREVLGLLAVHSAAFNETVLDRFDSPHNAGRKKIEFVGNDWYDLAQLRYVQAGSRWVTDDKRWVALARQADLADTIVSPDDL